MFSGYFQIDTVVMDLVVSVILLFTAIAVLVTIHVCIVGRAFTRSRFDINAANIAASPRISSKRPKMSGDDIRKLPSFDYKVEEVRGEVIPMECAVCLESFEVGEICRLLPNCQHSFHAQCIDSWLSKRAICPVGRTDANLANTGSKVGIQEKLELIWYGEMGTVNREFPTIGADDVSVLCGVDVLLLGKGILSCPQNTAFSFDNR